VHVGENLARLQGPYYLLISPGVVSEKTDQIFTCVHDIYIQTYI